MVEMVVGWKEEKNEKKKYGRSDSLRETRRKNIMWLTSEEEEKEEEY